jgi:DhnA family fructose-bisphosphate aldolase class Ia
VIVFLIRSCHVSQQSKLPTIVDCAHAATERWALEVNSGRTELDMYQKFLELTLDVIGKSGFGVQIDAGSESSTKVIQSFNQYLYDSRELIFGLPAVIPGYRCMSTPNPPIEQQEVCLNVL